MWGPAPPDLLLSSRLLGLISAPPAPELPNPRPLGAEDPRALVEKTFPADSGRRWQEVRAATSRLPAALAPPGTSAELETKFLGAPSGLQAGLASGGTPGPGESGGPGRRPRARGGVGRLGAERGRDPRPQQKARRTRAGSHRRPPPRVQGLPPGDHCPGPESIEENEVKPPVHRVRQRDLLRGNLLALPDAGPGSLRLPQEPAPRGLLSPGKHQGRGAPRGQALGTRVTRCSSTSLSLRDSAPEQGEPELGEDPSPFPLGFAAWGGGDRDP